MSKQTEPCSTRFGLRARHGFIGRFSARIISDLQRQPCRSLNVLLGGHLRCGEWFLFAGVHDLMHLEQLHGLKAGGATDG